MRTDALVMTVINENHKALKKELGEVISQSESDMWEKNKNLRAQVNQLQQRVRFMEQEKEKDEQASVVMNEYDQSMEELINNLSKTNKELDDLKYYYHHMVLEFIEEVKKTTGDDAIAESYVKNLWYKHAMKRKEQA
ncbi:integrating conjugative element protein (PFL_4705 family) [Bacillus phage Spock]|uniref:Uncharacterized protein n=2 Tax=Bequatrovirus spock TaxID=1918008 RepID=A0A1X9SFW7_9CAUD|nr:integrating conjugative element protein (PFL_4705 family) [Bacillus phage Spock]AGY48433.1 integrating conjugative element protein (PFL_4705 family) [Bacillus phage Spock]ARQ94948.1 hypothetical protein FLAPJACK_34 [Bacillus phage Flapjack]